MSWTQLKPPPVKKPVVKRGVAGKGAVRKTASVTPATTPPPDLNHVGAITEKVQVVEIVPGGGLLAGTDRGLYRTTDTTKGWDKLPFGGGLNENVYAIHVAPQRPDTIWIGTATSGVIVSRDGGKTWTKTGGAVDNVPVSSITSDPKRPDYIYVGTTQTFYVSRDDGKSWSRRGGHLPLGNFTSILINPNNTDEILLSSALDTDGGIFISTDAGQNWKRVDGKDQHLASRRFWSMAFDPQDTNRIYASTHSSGVYRIERAAATASALSNQ